MVWEDKLCIDASLPFVFWSALKIFTAVAILFAFDASGSWGCGTYWAHAWFQLAWSKCHSSARKNIATQEFLPIVLAATVWGRLWTGLHVQWKQ